MYRSFVSLGRYTPKYFILFVAMVNDIVSLVSLSVFSLLVYRNYLLLQKAFFRPQSLGLPASPLFNSLTIKVRPLIFQF